MNVKRIFNLTSEELETAVKEWLKNEHDVDTDDAEVQFSYAGPQGSGVEVTVTIEGEE